jgi:predicted MFS family arabinose efflux permease
MGVSLALLSLMAMLYFNNNSVLWFYTSTCLLYCCSSYLFAGGSYMASNAIEDRASASSMMSFINMGVATLSVVVMGYLSSNPFYGFLWILGSVILITLALLLRFSIKIKNHEEVLQS